MRHIDHFKRQYNKAIARDPLFGAHLMDCVHKRVQLFLHSCNMTAIEDVESGALTEFGGDSEIGRERGVVDFDVSKGGLASTK